MKSLGRLLALPALLAVALAGCGPGAREASPPARGAACMADPGADDGYCDRFMADLGRRTPLPADQAEPARAAETAVAQALSGRVLDRCNGGEGSCAELTAWGERPATPDEIRDRLAPIDPAAVVRVSGPADPGVTGSVVFGALVGTICVYGHQRFNKGPDRVYAGGPLPDGTCLADQ
ncbi:hypothetical protein AMIS_12450 [Actinoplanes missouriensis 431]|uniref:Lipoprotein n=1 Tax=Actinoplanes missouriensis (strain ATCC 14538 / DSM 43046 / CBS 188.64 / JCM 3121 / NBRC 102363 / NCIMB 12654 / NRRL B-3342 / UNCC 431) TaxID=512565 RepID=I0H0C8_ACTM4|nr:hypothetical protein [Actinoplanes missouriensis]BAL86465.1 hypothetical protein AMIS_12450 [Actinoplanes missouriensis 431]